MSSYLDTIRGAIFAGISLTAIFFAGAFFAGIFLAGAFFAGTFFAGIFLAGAFFAGTFFFVAIFNPPSRIIGLWRDRT